MIWRKRARKRRARHKLQVRRTAGRRSAGSVTAADDDDDAQPQFDGYAVELLDAVARLLDVRVELYAVPPHGASSARVGRMPHDYGMWSTLVDQLINEASSDFLSDFTKARRLSFSTLV